MHKLIRKHANEFLNALKKGHFFWSGDFLVFPHQKAGARGTYHHRLNFGPWAYGHNMLPDAGLTYFLAAALGGQPAELGWYLALYGSPIAPAGTWTASNFASNSGEITSTTEGYAGGARLPWTPNTAANRVIDNVGQEVNFNIVCTTPFDINGAALLSSAPRGSTGGVLASATQFSPAYQVQNGNVFSLGYEVELQDI